jgi:CMP/dCMP kinase
MAFILAIDGPAGAGKSTVSRRVAERLGLVLVDTGAIYRTAALLAKRRELTDEAEIATAVSSLDVVLRDGRVRLFGEDVSTEIRAPEISQASSVVSAMPSVRRALLDLQRRIAQQEPGGAVVEGRDIGTVVFPDAQLKIFLTASIEERAQRRKAELDSRGASQSIEQVTADIAIRDERDSRRSVAPLRAAEDAKLVDTTGRTIDQVVDEIARLAKERGFKGGLTYSVED